VLPPLQGCAEEALGRAAEVPRLNDMPKATRESATVMKPRPDIPGAGHISAFSKLGFILVFLVF